MEENFAKEQLNKYRERKSENNETIFKIQKRESPYVQIDKKVVEDGRLSWKAKGILLYLLSKPNDWQVYKSKLVKHSKGGRDSLTSGIKERSSDISKKKGVGLRRGFLRGGFIGYLKFHRSAINPKSDNPKSDNPLLLIKTHTNKD